MNNGTDIRTGMPKNRRGIRLLLVFYDTLAYILTSILLLWVYPYSITSLTGAESAYFALAGYICIFVLRMIFGIYRQIWRYGDVKAYMRLFAADGLAGAALILLRYTSLVPNPTFARTVAILALNLLLCVAMRLVYQFLYQSSLTARIPLFAFNALKFLTGVDLPREAGSRRQNSKKVRIAIVGAGRVGVMLAQELLGNPNSAYEPMCFIDQNDTKVGRSIYDLSIIPGDEEAVAQLEKLGVQEVVIALPGIDAEHRRTLYDYYHDAGFAVKIYDYPTIDSAETGGKRSLRSFDIEELLFRKTRDVISVETIGYYTGKTVLVTGGGGSIGSELCRQIARMKPKKLIALDVYENGAYDLQQELRARYGGALDFVVEIASVCDRELLRSIFGEHKPDIVIHAAAHKHVPLMNRNCAEAVKNNVFGTLNALEIAEETGCGRFLMVSTDKAVNPTNVMGATKRMCEMLVLNHVGAIHTSATRFGNVLGSAGSVVPLFRRQIKAGGPITLTDKRIIRYFMTIPEASQLVLESGTLAGRGELFVLDMGKPVKILDLAENMIRLSGLEPYKDIDIIETGLRPGEKLYEELLMNSDKLRATGNELIFVETDEAVAPEEIAGKLRVLKAAVDTNDNKAVEAALYETVPTFKTPEAVNGDAVRAREMKEAEN